MKKCFVASLLGYFFLLSAFTVSYGQGRDTASTSNSEVTGDDTDNFINNFPVPGDTVLQNFTFNLSPDSLRVYRSGKDFRYVKYIDSLLRQIQQSANDTSTGAKAKGAAKKKAGTDKTGDAIFSSIFVKLFFWTLATGFIGFILYRLFLTESLFKKNPRQSFTSEFRGEPEVTPAVFDLLIYDAIINKDYRLAIRYLYLQTLNKLAEKGLIKLSPDKTNNDYIKELSGSTHQKEFAGITRNYEYVWYGKFEVATEIFHKIERECKQYCKRL